MTDTEFARELQAIHASQARIQMALELGEWATTHPSILTSQAALDMAKDLIAKCQQIIKDAT